MPSGKHGDSVERKDLIEFYRGKRVLITGHTGFKGTWLCRILHQMGTQIYGYSLNPPTNPNLYNLLKTDNYVTSKIGDIANFDELYEFYNKVRPEIVFHLAAQPLVREGYRNPRTTYESNVMGTVNILECVRELGAKSFLNVTTDKVYDNLEIDHPYKENERLDGFDPYSNSKSCSELVTHSYVRSFGKDMCPISTARAGNVIGGGDFAPERIVPDCVRAAISGNAIILRNPNSIRPYQHVLEPLYSYLVIAQKQYIDQKLAGSYNIGPENADCITTKDLAELFCKYWGEDLKWTSQNDNGPHEANYLKLDNTLLKDTFGISPLWNSNIAVEKTVEWSKIWASNEDIEACIDGQIKDYLSQRGQYV